MSSDDPVKLYVDELQEIPPLDRAEEVECVQHVRAGDELADSAGKRLLEANLLLVVSIAERYKNDHIHILHLIKSGNEGLLRALRTFSDSGQDSFSAHATGHIERAIAEAISISGSTGQASVEPP